jgi:hypothetical protein
LTRITQLDAVFDHCQSVGLDGGTQICLCGSLGREA